MSINSSFLNILREFENKFYCFSIKYNSRLNCNYFLTSFDVSDNQKTYFMCLKVIDKVVKDELLLKLDSICFASKIVKNVGTSNESQIHLLQIHLGLQGIHFFYLKVKMHFHIENQWKRKKSSGCSSNFCPLLSIKFCFEFGKTNLGHKHNYKLTRKNAQFSTFILQKYSHCSFWKASCSTNLKNISIVKWVIGCWLHHCSSKDQISCLPGLGRELRPVF